MPSPSEYREHAAACSRLAETAKDADERACLIALANIWLKLAGQAENQDVPKRPKYPNEV